MATAQTLLQSAQYRFAQGPDNTRFANDFWSALNDSQNEIAVTRNWGFLRTSATLTTTADTRTVALPSDFCTPYRVKGGLRNTTEDSEIELMTIDQWHSSTFYEDGSSTGAPTYAYIMGTNLYLSPTPDDTYSLTFLYYKLPAEVNDTSGTITIPVKYHELLRTMVFRRLQEAGYSSVTEMQILDVDIQRLMNRAARDDIAEFGGFTMNLDGSSYTRRTT
ncbi:MAG: hypothetical protein WC554_00935 [Clostridia bacterium]|jgi:hypothetical protein